MLECFPQIWIVSKTSLALGRNFRLSLVDNSGVRSIPKKKKKKISDALNFDSLEIQKMTFPKMRLIISNTVNDRLSTAALISFFPVIGAALIQEWRLFQLRFQEFPKRYGFYLLISSAVTKVSR